jgi:hypothetical protein
MGRRKPFFFDLSDAEGQNMDRGLLAASEK